MIITSEPVTTGNKIYSKDTSDNNAISGFAAAGGWTLLKYIINVTDNPTEIPNVRNETPKIFRLKYKLNVQKEYLKVEQYHF